MEKLKFEREGFILYKAGLPKFPRTFSRDGIISAILMNNINMLRDQISFSASEQGLKKNPYNGEELGKIFHEYPGVKIRGLSTKFNACDTTALYLIGHEFYQKLTNDKKFANEQRRKIELATNYILSHLEDYLFFEDPKFCGAKKFALKSTYWKDSVIPDRENGEPVYPVVYTLAHIQNMCGLRSAAKLINSKKLKKTAEEMKKRLQKLYDEELGTFYIAIDKEGPIRGVSSDSLHALFYLRRSDLSDEQLRKIVQSAGELETPLGYRTFNPQPSYKLPEYHYGSIWPFEQAIIHAGAKKLGLNHVIKVSSKIISYLDTDPEMFVFKNDIIKKGGCDPQLFTIASKKYFK